MLYDDTTAGQTFELYGPKNYSTKEISELVDKEIHKKRRHINIPKPIIRPIAHLLNRFIWWPVLSAEDVDREFIDQEIDETAKTFADLGITPGEISDFTYEYLVSISFALSRLSKRIYYTNNLNSVDCVVTHTTISPQQQRRRRRKTGSIFMSWTSLKYNFSL